MVWRGRSEDIADGVREHTAGKAATGLPTLTTIEAFSRCSNALESLAPFCLMPLEDRCGSWLRDPSELGVRTPGRGRDASGDAVGQDGSMRRGWRLFVCIHGISDTAMCFDGPAFDLEGIEMSARQIGCGDVRVGWWSRPGKWASVASRVERAGKCDVGVWLDASQPHSTVPATPP